MDAFLRSKGPQYFNKLSKKAVDEKLQGPHRLSEGLMKYDHVLREKVLTFARDGSGGVYKDRVLPCGRIHVQEAKDTRENAKLKATMASLTRLPGVQALLSTSDRGALEFTVTITPHPTEPGWLASLQKLSSKRRVPLQPMTAPVDKRMRTLTSFFNSN